MYRFNKNSCLVNISSSILRHYGIKPIHESYNPLDAILDTKKHAKLVVFLFDAFGAKTLKKYKKEAKFIYKNRFKKIDAVFPPTTVASTTAFLSSLYPSETAYLGWWTRTNDTVCTTFSSTIVHSFETHSPRIDEILPYKNIIQIINDKYGKELATLIFSFKLETNDPESFMKEVDKELETHDFVYAYFTQPDSLMHEEGTNSEKVGKMISSINDSLESFCKRHQDVLIISIADHDMVDSIPCDHQEELLKLIDGYLAVEPRAASFIVKEENRKQFIQLYKNYYKNDFNIFTKDEVIEQELFGPKVNRHPLFDKIIGDYLLVAKSNKSFSINDDFIMKGLHGGGTKEEAKIYLCIYNEEHI